jgi:hypothetical protein
MIHPEWQDALDAYVNGDLDAPQKERLLEHLNACDRCRGEAEALTRIVKEAAELPRAIQPPSHIWWRIRESLANAPDKVPETSAARSLNMRFRFALAALALVAVFGAAALMAPGRHETTATTAAAKPDSSEPDLTVISNDAKSQPSEWAQMIWSLEKESLNAEKAVFTGLAGHIDAAALARASEVEPALRALDTAINETAEAMRLEPGNTMLARTLTGYYERKLELLRMAARLASGTWA